MTSAPVKDVGSLMNFAGTGNRKAVGSANSSLGFGAVMNKVSVDGSNTDALRQSESRKEASMPAVDNTTQKSPLKMKPEDSVDASGEITTSQQQEVEEAGEKLVEAVAKELGVSQEEVELKMAELGLTIYALFEPSQLTSLVMQISGESDAATLLTDEKLFGKLQELLQMADGMKNQLMQEMEMNPNQWQELLQKMQEATGIQQDIQPEAMQEQTTEATPKIVVETRQMGETVKIAVDADSNTQNVADAPRKSEQTGEERQPKQQETGGEQKEMYHSENTVTDVGLPSKAPAMEAVSEPVSQIFGQSTQDIMNQILDYMKIQLKPDVQQLDMQLHPESLGTVHIQLTNKGGEVTAQFHVQNEAVKAAIEGQVVDLRESLREQGVKVEAVEVTVESHGFESNLWQGSEREENAFSQKEKKAPRRINLNEIDRLFEETASEEDALAAKMMEVNGNTVDYTV